MNSTRRGFLGFLGGGAVAGPGALKKAVASTAIQEAVAVTSGAASDSPIADPRWRAKDILHFIRSAPRGSVTRSHIDKDMNIEALKSVSPAIKARMQMERHMDVALAHQVREFLIENKLNWVGLDESQILSLVKKAAGE